MTNHISYPFHELHKGCCVICFKDNNNDFSACYLSDNTKKYLSESGYIDGAYRIDYKTESGEVYHMTRGEFLRFLENGELKPEYSESAMLMDNGESRKCPLCGKSLTVKVAGKGSNAGHLFYSCSGYPECRFIDNIE